MTLVLEAPVASTRLEAAYAVSFDAGTEDFPAPVTTAIFGGGEDGFDWTMRGAEEAWKNGSRNELSRRINYVAETLRVDTIYSPSPVLFNGSICERAELTRRFELVSGKGNTLHRGVEADGCKLEAGEAIGWSVGGCAVIVATYRGHMVAAHAGRDCLFDRSAFDQNAARDPTRTHEGVVHAALDALNAQDMSEVRVHVLYPLSAQTLTHPLHDPKYGKVNVAMYEYLRDRWSRGLPEHWGVWEENNHILIDTYLLVRSQCVADFDIDPRHVQLRAPYADTLEGVYHTRLKDEAQRLKRNFAIVARSRGR